MKCSICYKEAHYTIKFYSQYKTFKEFAYATEIHAARCKNHIFTKEKIMTKVT